MKYTKMKITLKQVKRIFLSLILIMLIHGCAQAKNHGLEASARKDMTSKWPLGTAAVKPSGKPNVFYFLLSEDYKRKGDAANALVETDETNNTVVSGLIQR